MSGIEHERYGVPVASLEHAEFCRHEAERRYGGKIIMDDCGMLVVEDASGELHTDDVLRALSRYNASPEALEKQRLTWACMDCDIDTSEPPGNIYRLCDQLWKQITKPTKGDGMLCIACVSKRMGRELTDEDFEITPAETARMMLEYDQDNWRQAEFNRRANLIADALDGADDVDEYLASDLLTMFLGQELAHWRADDRKLVRKDMIRDIDSHARGWEHDA